jgi:phosphatidylserine/phosphatidylglycerophosphate/cardiolipin synthase-like enzyme
MEIHFDNIKQIIIENLKDAKFNVFASVAWIGENFIIQELTNCLKRGIQVEIIVNDDDRFKYYKAKFIEFLELGGKLYLYDTTSALMHNKFCVIDLCTTITGSFNWTHGATFHRENIIVEKKNIEMAHTFALEFNSLKRNSTLFSNSKSGNVELAHKVKVTSCTISSDELGNSAILELTEGKRKGYLILNTDFVPDPSFIPNEIQGFWKSKLTVETFGNPETDKFEYYEFICIDPDYMKYL